MGSLEDAEEEQVEILVNHAPRRFVLEDGILVGMELTGWNGIRRPGIRHSSTPSLYRATM